MPSNDVYNDFTEFKPSLHDARYLGAIIGRVQRRPGVGAKEARSIAEGYPWWRKGMVYDGRCRRWHVFREKA